MMKPLQGSHFRNLRDYIMGRVSSTKPKHDVISVGKKTNKAVTKKSKINGKSCITMTSSKRRVKLLAQWQVSLYHRSVLGFIELCNPETEFCFEWKCNSVLVSWKWNSVSVWLRNGFPFPGVFSCIRTHVPRLKLKQDLWAKDLATSLFPCVAHSRI